MDSIWTQNGQHLSATSRGNVTSRLAHKRVRNLTIAIDLIIINLGFYFAYLARYSWQILREVEKSEYIVPFLIYLPQQLLLNVFLVAAFSMTSVWRRRRGESWYDEVYRVGTAMTASFMLLIAFQFGFRPEANSRLMIFWSALFIGIMIAFARLIRRWSMRYMYNKGITADSALVVGSGEAGRGVIRTLLARPDLGFKAIGFLDDGTNLGSRRIPHLGTWTALDDTLAANPNLHTVFIALPANRHADIIQATQACVEYGIRTQIVPDLLQLSLGKVEMNNMGGIPVLSVRTTQISVFGRVLKRLLDLSIVAIFAIPGLLVGAAIAIAIKLEDGGPIFYKAKRLGAGGKEIGMYKFRSMVLDADKLRDKLWEQNEAEGAIFKIKDDPRVTKTGTFIRKMSLDELPQFINIFLGHMSFVGPRPPIQDEVDQYEEWHHRRLEFKGGLTGLWQVSGRADLTFDEAVLLDIYYIENWSLALDLRIILQTIPYVLLRRGAY